MGTTPARSAVRQIVSPISAEGLIFPSILYCNTPRLHHSQLQNRGRGRRGGRERSFLAALSYLTKSSSRVLSTKSPTPGSLLARGPATFSTLTPCSLRLSAMLVSPAQRCSRGLLCFRAKSMVFFEPPGQSRFNRKQNGSVTISHIPFGPLNVGSRRRFFQRILRINRPVFGFAALWAPSAAFHIVRERPIQGSPVPSRFVRRKQSSEFLSPQTNGIYVHWRSSAFRLTDYCNSCFYELLLSTTKKGGTSAINRETH